MAPGVEHSAPLRVKYHRLQHSWQPRRRRLPFQKTRNPVVSDVFLKMHSFKMAKRRKIREVNRNFFPFFINTQSIVGSPRGKHFKNVSNLSHSTTQAVVFTVLKRCGITTRQTEANLHNTKSSHDATNDF